MDPFENTEKSIDHRLEDIEKEHENLNKRKKILTEESENLKRQRFALQEEKRSEEYLQNFKNKFPEMQDIFKDIESILDLEEVKLSLKWYLGIYQNKIVTHAQTEAEVCNNLLKMLWKKEIDEISLTSILPLKYGIPVTDFMIKEEEKLDSYFQWLKGTNPQLADEEIKFILNMPCVKACANWWISICGEHIVAQERNEYKLCQILLKLEEEGCLKPSDSLMSPIKGPITYYCR